MDLCEPVFRTPSFRRTQGRLFARKKSSITADDDEFEILARSAPVPRPPPTLLSPKLGVSFQLRSSTHDTMVVTDDAPSPRMLPFLRGPSTRGPHAVSSAPQGVSGQQRPSCRPQGAGLPVDPWMPVVVAAAAQLEGITRGCQWARVARRVQCSSTAPCFLHPGAAWAGRRRRRTTTDPPCPSAHASRFVRTHYDWLVLFCAACSPLGAWGVCLR